MPRPIQFRSTPLNAGSGPVPSRAYSVGSYCLVELMDHIIVLGVQARKHSLPLQPGDVLDTYAGTAGVVADIGYQSGITVAECTRWLVDGCRTHLAKCVRIGA